MYVDKEVGAAHSLGNQTWARTFLSGAIGSVKIVCSRIMYADAAVGISERRARARIFSVLAPTQAVQDESIHVEFFAAVRAELASVPTGWITFLNADFNAALGPFASAGSGAFSPDKENEGGTRLRELVAERGITLLNILREHAQLSSWRSATGR